MKTTYFGITIGPIYDTIRRAKKTRELWAGSYVFSLLMQYILEALPASMEVVLPCAEDLKNNSKEEEKLYGAGIWPDRCILKTSENDKAAKQIEDAIEKAISKLQQKLSLDEGWDLKKYFRIFYFRLEEEKIEQDSSFLESINTALDNLELSAHYLRKESPLLVEILEKNIHCLYKVAKREPETSGDTVFIKTPKDKMRLPSLTEIALKELKEHPEEWVKNAYIENVEEEISRQVDEAEEKVKKDEAELIKNLYEELKKKPEQKAQTGDAAALPLKFRHKYAAVVTADGDKVGQYIKNLLDEDKEKDTFNRFSKNLINFSKKATKTIFKYGALPVYVGGDDLLFIAPLTNHHSPSESKNILELCYKLNELFKDEIHPKLSLSFGLSVNYHKFPLNEAIADSYSLLQKAKQFEKKDGRRKEAICFKVHKHSGAEFTALLHMGSSNTFKAIMELLNEDLKTSFLSSWMYKMMSLAPLFTDALKNNRTDHFRKNNFNEGGKHEKLFLKKAMMLGQSLYAEYADVIYKERFMKEFFRKTGLETWVTDPPNQYDLNCYVVETLHAILRLKHFLTDDYEQ